MFIVPISDKNRVTKSSLASLKARSANHVKYGLTHRSLSLSHLLRHALQERQLIHFFYLSDLCGTKQIDLYILRKLQNRRICFLSHRKFLEPCHILRPDPLIYEINFTFTRPTTVKATKKPILLYPLKTNGSANIAQNFIRRIQ